MITKASLIQSVKCATDLSNREVSNCISALIETLSEGLANGERVELRGFGTFTVKMISGKKISFSNVGPDYKSDYVRICFKPSKGLKLAARKKVA